MITAVTGALSAYGDVALVAVMLGCALLAGLVCLLCLPRQMGQELPIISVATGQ